MPYVCMEKRHSEIQVLSQLTHSNKKGKKIYGWKSFGDIVSTVYFRQTQGKNITGRLSLGSQLRLSEKGVEGGSKSQLRKEAFPAPHRVNTQHYLQNCSPVSSRF